MFINWLSAALQHFSKRLIEHLKKTGVVVTIFFDYLCQAVQNDLVWSVIREDVFDTFGRVTWPWSGFLRHSRGT